MTARVAFLAAATSLLAPAIATAQANAARAPRDPPALDAAWIVAGVAILLVMIALLVGPGVLRRARGNGAGARRRVREGA